MTKPKKRDALDRPSSINGLAEQEETAEVLRLRRERNTYPEIAAKLNISEHRAKAIVRAREAVLIEEMREDTLPSIIANTLNEIDRKSAYATALGFGGLLRDFESGDLVVDSDGKPQRGIPDIRWAIEARKLIELKMRYLGFDVKTVRVEGMGAKQETTAVVPTDPVELALLEALISAGVDPANVLPAKGESGAVDAEFVAVPAATPQIVEDVEADVDDESDESE